MYKRHKIIMKSVSGDTIKIYNDVAEAAKDLKTTERHIYNMVIYKWGVKKRGFYLEYGIKINRESYELEGDTRHQLFVSGQ